MSGISGVFYFKDKKTKKGEIDELILPIKHRGEDGIFKSETDEVSFAFLKLNNQACSVLEKPIETNELLIIADARIDDRDNLIFKLGLDPKVVYSATELIFESFKKYGENILDHIIGDFTFAIFLKDQAKLILGRDHMGVRPLYYYHKKGEYFAFSSELKSFVNLTDKKVNINKLEVERYLRFSAPKVKYPKTTLFSDFFACLPAHILSIDKLEEFNEKEYWNIDENKYSHFSTDEEFINEFKYLFKESVKDRVQSDFGISGDLSGGLDSSSIVVQASCFLKKPINTFHYSPLNFQVDETEYAEAVLEKYNFNHHYVKLTENFIQDNKLVNKILDLPDNTTIPRAFFDIEKLSKVNSLNSRTFLTGHDGDAVVGHGFEYFNILIEQGEFKKLKSVIDLIIRDKDFNTRNKKWFNLSLKEKARWYKYVFLFKKNTMFLLFQKKYKAMFLFALEMIKIDGIEYSSLLKDAFNLFLNKKSSLEKKKREESLSFNIDTSVSKSEVINHLSRIRIEVMTTLCETLNVLGAYYKIDYTHPFLDKRIIELCICSPIELKFNNGKNRGLLRQAIKGKLPQKVLERSSKVEFTPTITLGLVKFISSIKNELFKNEGNDKIFLDKFVENEKLLVSLDILSRSEEIETSIILHTDRIQRSLNLKNWIRNNNLNKKQQIL